jgi:hypothetical protein
MGISSEDAWQLAAEKAGLTSEQCAELRFFDVQSDRGFRIASLLNEKTTNFLTVGERYKNYLETKWDRFALEKEPNHELIRYISANFRTPDQELRPDVIILHDYIESGNKQCSHCGGKGGIVCEAGKLPKGIKPQLFSNRLMGGNTSKVKRNVCEICQKSFLVEKLMCDTYENHYYLHLFADGGEHSSHAEPGVFLESLKQSIRNLQRTDCRCFLIQPNEILKNFLKNQDPIIHGKLTKKWGLIVPKFSESIGGQISIGINPPGGKEANDSIRFLFALFHLLLITNHFNLRGILGKSSIPSLKPDEFGSLFIEHVPLSFKALIPENVLSHQKAESLWYKFKSIYGLRNTYNKIDEKEIVKIAKMLFDETGLDLFNFLRKAYGKTDRIKKFPPWAQAWPYLKQFIQEDYLMPIKKMAEIALKNHFHGKSFKETSQAKPLDLAFDAISKHHPPESLEDLKMIVLHDVTRGLERLSSSGSLGKDRYNAAKDFVETFFNEIFSVRYKSDKNRLIKDKRRIRSAFIGYLNVLRDELKNESKQQ